MKIQCSCGSKYAFDVSPEMAKSPVRFVCPACGRDSSDFVNSLIRQELGVSGPATATPVAAPAPVATLIQPAAPPPPVARVRLPAPAAGPAGAEPAETSAPPRCFKHPDQLVSDKCYVCSKPICPKCMELFGYVCSPLCKAKAESHGIAVPVYARQRSVVEARFWRKTFRIVAAVGGLAVVLLGVWFWYAWFGSVPKVIWSVRFPERSYSGESAFCGQDQIVVLHGDLLARHDMKLKREVWSRHLVDKQRITAAVAAEMKAMQTIIDKANNDNPDHVPKMPNPEKLQQAMQRAAEAALELVVRGQNIWVLSPGKLTRYDRDTGNPAKEIRVPAGYGGLIPRGDELLDMDLETGKPLLTRINLNTCESRTEDVLPAAAPPPATAGKTNLANAKPGVRTAPAGKGGSGKAGLPIGMPGKDAGQVMDPDLVAE